jgi:hypothetical protein
MQTYFGCVESRLMEGMLTHDKVVEQSLDKIVPRLLDRFASKEGYKLFDDTLPCRS